MLNIRGRVVSYAHGIVLFVIYVSHFYGGELYRLSHIVGIKLQVPILIKTSRGVLIKNNPAIINFGVNNFLNYEFIVALRRYCMSIQSLLNKSLGQTK